MTCRPTSTGSSDRRTRPRGSPSEDSGLAEIRVVVVTDHVAECVGRPVTRPTSGHARLLTRRRVAGGGVCAAGVEDRGRTDGVLDRHGALPAIRARAVVQPNPPDLGAVRLSDDRYRHLLA